MTHFNPATVWFEHDKKLMSTWVDEKFQSRNGLIWTPIESDDSGTGLEFQSRNGLIWTILKRNHIANPSFISIPQRSDLNLL